MCLQHIQFVIAAARVLRALKAVHVWACVLAWMPVERAWASIASVLTYDACVFAFCERWRHASVR
eukprot:3237314-Pleurochrysis_carterae.AAC.1